MRFVVWLAALCTLVAAASPQQRAGQPLGAQAGGGRGGKTTWFRPQHGETVLELTIEKRGEVFIDLNTALAPKATERIITLTRQGFFNGQRFFKVMKSPRPYLVQTGDPQSRTLAMDDPRLGAAGSGTSVPYEDTHLPYSVGSVVLATVNGNRDSGDSQFYILLADYSKLLEGTGTVFGRVVVGLETVSKIELGDRILVAQILSG
ncbi:MAG TPA: peptidylprolyl isomerase [Fimbriimonadaceae bacterium]|nr:peptidylprolyl isomerase [Fimbriimonadaceae bacterium]